MILSIFIVKARLHLTLKNIKLLSVCIIIKNSHNKCKKIDLLTINIIKHINQYLSYI